MTKMRPLSVLSMALALVSAPLCSAQDPSPAPAIQPLSPGANPAVPSHTLQALATPVLSPQVLELVKLEDRFEQAVAKGGGPAFASWFAPDGVTLNNGKPAVQGQRAIASTATWDAKSYQLEWYVEGAQMGPSGDSGFTWGHYDGHATDKDGHPTISSGRYITFWKKVDGQWKVALDASAIDAP